MDLDDAELETQLRDALHRAAEPVHGEGIFKETIRNEAARRQSARRKARWTGRIVLAAAAAAVVVGAVVVLAGPDGDRVGTDGGPVATEPEVPTTEVERPDTTEAPGTSSTTPTTEAEPVQTTTTSTTPPLPEFPPAFTAVLHGQQYWGVYLAAAPEGQVDDPAFQAALQAMGDAGYSADGYTGLACDEGAAEALGQDPSSWVVVAYFEAQADAEQARAAFEARGQQVLGVVHVRTYCLD